MKTIKLQSGLQAQRTSPTRIDITPVGLTTPEGSQRVAAALKAFEASHVIVANAATQFIERYCREIRQAVNAEEGAGDELDELLAMIENRSEVQDEFLRAVAGAPARAVTR